jgi:hypothetical protein
LCYRPDHTIQFFSGILYHDENKQIIELYNDNNEYLMNGNIKIDEFQKIFSGQYVQYYLKKWTIMNMKETSLESLVIANENNKKLKRENSPFKNHNQY